MLVQSSIPKKRILVIFKDDSSLLSARKFAAIFDTRGFKIFLCHSYNKKYKRQELSERQLKEGLAERKVDYTMEMSDVVKEGFLNQFDVIASCKFPTIFQLKFILGSWKFSDKRPCFVATFPGIDFTPKLGIKVRKYADILCVNGPLDKSAYLKYVPKFMRKKQKVVQFSPFFYRSLPLKRVASPKKVVFFSQSIMPATKQSRIEVLETLLKAAKVHPAVEFVFKLRHLECENRHHTHIEEYSFEALAKELEGEYLPENFRFSSEYIGELLKTTDLSLTCASTAGVEALGLGVPNMFFSNYSGAKNELHYEKMMEFAKGSGMISGAENILKLKMPDLNKRWLENNLTTDEMIDSLVVEIHKFDPSSKILDNRWARYCPNFVEKVATLFL